VTIATNMAGRGTDIQLGGNAEMRIKSELAAITDEAERTRMIEALRAEGDSLLVAGSLHRMGEPVSSVQAKLSEVMDPHVLKVDATTPKEDVAALIAKYDLLALPVVDARRKLLGTVTVDDVVEIMMPRGWKKRSLRSIAR